LEVSDPKERLEKNINKADYTLLFYALKPGGLRGLNGYPDSLNRRVIGLAAENILSWAEGSQKEEI